MDIVCRFLSTDLHCLLMQMIKSLGFGEEESCSSRKTSKVEIEECPQVIYEEKEEKQEEQEEQGGDYHLVIYPSYEIRNKYPGPLITYDGEERCEPRLIRFSDLSGKNGNSIIKDCFGTEAENSEESNEESEEEEEEEWEEESEEASEEEKSEEESFSAKKYLQNLIGRLYEEPQIQENKCPTKKIHPQKRRRKRIDIQCQTSFCSPKEAQSINSNSNEEFNEEAQEHLLHLVKNIFPRGNRKTNGCPQRCCSPEEAPPSDELNRHDLCAKKLYEMCIRNIPNSLPWNCLKPEQKLRFQWKAIVGDDLQETPYGNFRLGFIRNFRKAFPRASSHRLRTEMRLQWCHMERSNRLPFILQALLYHVSTGHLDPQDHCAIRGLFNRFQ